MFAAGTLFKLIELFVNCPTAPLFIQKYTPPLLVWVRELFRNWLLRTFVVPGEYIWKKATLLSTSPDRFPVTRMLSMVMIPPSDSMSIPALLCIELVSPRVKVRLLIFKEPPKGSMVIPVPHTGPQ